MGKITKEKKLRRECRRGGRGGSEHRRGAEGVPSKYGSGGGNSNQKGEKISDSFNGTNLRD